MTLLEVLVAFVIFLMLVGALVTLATAGLDTWTMGEERKDVFDRAQRILDQVSEDLRCTLADENWVFDTGGRELQHAYFVLDADVNKVPRLRFVRTGAVNRINVDPTVRIRRPQPDLNYTTVWEVCYAMDSDPTKPHLLRGVRFFDRRLKESLLNAEDIEKTSSRVAAQYFRTIDTGVLWIAFRCWTPYTTSWALPPERVYVCGGRGHNLVSMPLPGKCPSCGRDMEEKTGVRVTRTRDPKALVGPSLLWDSSRCIGEGNLAQFVNHRTVKRRDDPDFCYPEIVQVTLVVESQASEHRGTKLTDGISDSDMTLRLDNMRGVPDAPNYVRIGTEWLEYSAKRGNELTLKRRGARGTDAASHQPGDRVRFGETFTTDVHVPAYKEIVR